MITNPKTKPNPLTKLTITLLIPILAKAQTTVPETKDFAGRFGVGPGVVLIFFMIIVGACMCIAARASEKPLNLSIVGFLLPVLTFLVLYWLPKEADRPVTSKRGNSDWTLVVNILFYYLIFFFFFVGKFFIFPLCLMF